MPNGGGGVGYGVDLVQVAGTTTGNILQRLHIYGNADEGIHFGAGTNANTLRNSKFLNNSLEQIYLLTTTDNIITDNEMTGGTVGIYIKDSDGNTITRNVCSRVIQVIGDSDNNVLTSNIAKNGLNIQVQSPDVPNNNTVQGGIVGGASNCIRLLSTTGNLIKDVIIDTATCTSKDVQTTSSVDATSDNTFIGVQHDQSRQEVTGASILRVGWHLGAHVESVGGAPISGATVQALDDGAVQLFSVLTDSGGNISQDVIEYVNTGGTKAFNTPMSLEVSATGFTPVTDSSIALTTNMVRPIVMTPTTGSPPGGRVIIRP